jgi:hypothetical protein
MMQNYIIVGAKFRPPAKALLDTLATGTELLARREPSNAYDANAIQVIVRSSAIAPSDAMKLAVEQYGRTMDEIRAAEEWQLGYVPREAAASVAPKLDADAITVVVGSLTFSASGVPCIRMEVPDART